MVVLVEFKLVCYQTQVHKLFFLHREVTSALQRQFRLYIPFLGVARPQPQFPISCVCERFIRIFPGSVHILFPPAEKADPSWKYIIRSQTHECGNWDRGPDIPFLGIFVSNFRHFVFAVCLHVDTKNGAATKRWILQRLRHKMVFA
jgi:hypothetical protein